MEIRWVVPPEPAETLRLVLWRPLDGPDVEPGDIVIERSAQPSERLTNLALNERPAMSRSIDCCVRKSGLPQSRNVCESADWAAGGAAGTPELPVIDGFDGSRVGVDVGKGSGVDVGVDVGGDVAVAVGRGGEVAVAVAVGPHETLGVSPSSPDTSVGMLVPGPRSCAWAV